MRPDAAQTREGNELRMRDLTRGPLRPFGVAATSPSSSIAADAASIAADEAPQGVCGSIRYGCLPPTSSDRTRAGHARRSRNTAAPVRPATGSARKTRCAGCPACHGSGATAPSATGRRPSRSSRSRHPVRNWPCLQQPGSVEPARGERARRPPLRTVRCRPGEEPGPDRHRGPRSQQRRHGGVHRESIGPA